MFERYGRPRSTLRLPPDLLENSDEIVLQMVNQGSILRLRATSYRRKGSADVKTGGYTLHNSPAMYHPAIVMP